MKKNRYNMKSFEDVINDKDSLNENMVDKWINRKLTSEMYFTSINGIATVLKDVLKEIDKINDRLEAIENGGRLTQKGEDG